MRMRPGAFSRSGFLGPGERLGDVLTADAEVLQKLKVSHEELASKLDALVAAAEKSPDHQSRQGVLQCRIQLRQGFQICPWAPNPHRAQCAAGLGVQHGSVDWWLTNLKTGERIEGPGIAVHLIRDHHFFEGQESPHRVDPTRLARVLNLA